MFLACTSVVGLCCIILAGDGFFAGPRPASGHPHRVRHPQSCHPVQHSAFDCSLDLLVLKGPCGIDNDVSRALTRPPWQAHRQPRLPSAHRAVVRHRELKPHDLHDRLQEPLCGSRAKVKDSLEDEGALDGSVGVDPWPAGSAAARRLSPCGDRGLIEPERELPSTNQCPVIRVPVSDLVAEGEFRFRHPRMFAGTCRSQFCNKATSSLMAGSCASPLALPPPSCSLRRPCVPPRTPGSSREGSGAWRRPRHSSQFSLRPGCRVAPTSGAAEACRDQPRGSTGAAAFAVDSASKERARRPLSSRTRSAKKKGPARVAHGASSSLGGRKRITRRRPRRDGSGARARRPASALTGPVRPWRRFGCRSMGRPGFRAPS